MPITTLKLWGQIPYMAMYNRYNIMWYSLSVSCGRSVVQSNLLICIQQMSEHNIHLCGVFNNTINEIPARGDNAGFLRQDVTEILLKVALNTITSLSLLRYNFSYNLEGNFLFEWIVFRPRTNTMSMDFLNILWFMRLTQSISIQLLFFWWGGGGNAHLIYLWVITENYFYIFLSIKISILSCYVSVEVQTILIYTYFFPFKVHLNGQIFLSSSLQTLPFFCFKRKFDSQKIYPTLSLLIFGEPGQHFWHV